MIGRKKFELKATRNANMIILTFVVDTSDRNLETPFPGFNPLFRGSLKYCQVVR
jgi:hypothetical protein